MGAATAATHRRRRKSPSSTFQLAVIVVLVNLVNLQWSSVRSQSIDNGAGTASQLDNPAVVDLVTRTVYNRIYNQTHSLFDNEFADKFKFCILNRDEEWDHAFNYSSDLTFLSACVTRTRGDIQRRLCTAAEISFYFSNTITSGSNYLKANRNCNLTSWVPGCEPGWACSTDPDQNPDLRDSREIPARTVACQPCCEGFFCPHGLTCMIPCPLGSYCPLATLNVNTGICEPYSYQLPPGQPNHTCGGANIWSDVRSSSEVFCSAGSYCPTNTEKNPCTSGNYCPTGSTAEKRCFKLTSCNPNTASQNIHAYGAMLIAALATLLLIIYNCSDQIITIRERRLARSREAAAKVVKEKIQARARWKAAKEAAKKHAVELQGQLSHKFSRKRNVTISDKVTLMNQQDTDIDGNSYSSKEHSTSSVSKNSLSTSEVEELGSIPLMEVINEIEDHTFDSSDSFSLEIKEKNLKSKKPKGKEIQTRSQIFKYAYAQLEREKAQQQQNKNLTFSGVISMATNTDYKKRPVIEIGFTGLTVTLKGKKKHLLRSVNGKIMPGRITAVMGPSGAGKTTLLSALAGKTVGCTISGSILINGKPEPIHSYRKIVGFVPQDDIVHGNLTVEENLWFSARCRLSADLPKPDKVLIVERVIEFLGLQSVRGSLVGTVEKRGISGGQRKRVNVGLELVMEPSLLFLDEPTSGLDSASSQLLIRALRREALEGVNICMVVHQPSYTLFKMFDDLILLAKGGLVVYHGPVKKVEDYFAGLGIDVPERVNPPDHFIDVLEGLVKPTTNSNVDYKELPVLWMLHNGYSVPPEMQQSAAVLASSPVDVNNGNQAIFDHVTEEHSFAGEMWQDMKTNVERQRDIILHNFMMSKDLSNRRTPNVLLQYKYFIGRISKQRLREAKMQAIDYLILLVAGACLGSLTKVRDESFGAPGYTHTIIAVSLLCKIAALRTFALDKLQYWRESASGISSVAHFVAKDTIDHFNTVIKPAVYLSMYYFFCNPRSSFAANYIVLLCLVYCVTGMGYAFAIFLAPGPSQLCSVLVPVVLTLIASRTDGGKFLKVLADLCYPKWALEAFVISNAERYYGVWLITRCGALMNWGYSLHDWSLSLCILLLIGLGSRIIAFIGMISFQKK
ncbi:ABC transporter G family member 24-like isoform X1 [Nicotiana tomentosiformis]|uniref:ABC transporter G family member 24-like isoform X1 n=1 Tax=Nicotiana tomentosiformis TaxID=4098 RepID=UPI00051B37F2|nr:ABC transporter G family member 24-like isoform X1 [Nicotiana tomentosiformis]